MKLILLPQDGSSSIGLCGETSERSFMPTGWVWILNNDCDESAWNSKVNTGYLWNMF